MRTRRTCQRIGRCTAALVAGAAGLALPCGAVLAQQPEPVERRAAGTDGITGRSFAGLSVGSAVQMGDLKFGAAVGWAWNEEEDLAPGGDPLSTGPTQRLMLSGDVAVEIGGYRFSAARAVAWVHQLGVAEEDPDLPVYQVAVYFDRVGDPAAEAGLSQFGDRLLVTGVTAGRLTMKADLLRGGRPADPLVREGEARLARLLGDMTGERVASGPAEPVAGGAGLRGPITPGLSRPFEPESNLLRGEGAAEAVTAWTKEPEPIFAKGGFITLAGKEPSVVAGAEGVTVIVTGGVTVQYIDLREGKNLEITAERAVVFLRQRRLAELGQFKQEDVLGMYMEGDVVVTSDNPRTGRYTLRGPKVYYDVENDTALMPDAVFWTYDEQKGFPLYLRAKVLRQETSDRFVAERARLATSSFFEPHLAIGASSITVSRVPERGGGAGTETYVEASDATLRAGGFPFFYWPWFEGYVQNFPLKSVEVGRAANSTAIRTTWDWFGLLNAEAPAGVDARLLVDGYFDRGAAVGTEATWIRDEVRGSLFAYSLLNDDGTDKLGSGAEIDRDGETRGLVLAENIWTIDENWSLFGEAAYVSDETFVNSFFRSWSESRREFTNAAYLRYLEGNSGFTVLAKGEIGDFTPNEYLLQSQGYTVDKLPEVAYYRIADDLTPDSLPGLVSYSSEYRLSRMQLNFTEPTAAELGFNTNLRAQEAFGLLPDQSLGDRLRAQGYSEGEVYRFDTRQEVSMTVDFGPLKLVPFAVGRVTGYDDDFEDFNNDSDSIRLWGAVGARVSTTITKIDDSVDSNFLDLHRIRHIIEPSVTVWTAGANLSQNDLPVYDDAVESLQTGSAVRAGVTQVWQTQRGGPGQWRSVDVVRLTTDVVVSGGDTDKESPVGRFFDYRPEYSLLGDYATLDAAWQVTDSVGLIVNTVYDFDINQPARTIAGGTIQHAPDFRTYAQARYINARDITLVDFGAEYELTRVYLLNFSVTYDTDEKDFQNINSTLRRRFPGATLGVRVSYDNIADDLSLGIVLEPVGVQSVQPLRRLDRSTARPLFGG